MRYFTPSLERVKNGMRIVLNFLHKPSTISTKLSRTSLCALYESKTFRKNFHQNNLMIFCRPPYRGILYMVSFRFFKLFHFFNYHSSILLIQLSRKKFRLCYQGFLTGSIHLKKISILCIRGVIPVNGLHFFGVENL